MRTWPSKEVYTLVENGNGVFTTDNCNHIESYMKTAFGDNYKEFRNKLRVGNVNIFKGNGRTIQVISSFIHPEA